MAVARLRTMLVQMRRLVTAGPEEDAELLGRFVAARDTNAFELLVWRHGAMVFGLCHNVCRSEQDAEDAFQATFLALARKAGAIGRRRSVGSWLYKVALRAALRARAVTAARAARERPLGNCPALADSECTSDMRALVRDEVYRLPEKYQRPLVLFHFEGKSLDEVALELGCAVGTVGSRLSRARGRLRQRLAGHGLALSLAAAAAGGAQAMPPADLVAGTVRAALTLESLTGVVSSNVACLTEGVLRAMFWNKLKFVASFALAAAVVTAGLAGVSYGLLAAEDDKKAPPPAASTPTSGVIFKGFGTVLDPDGDCKFTVQSDKLTITLPGKDHALCIEQNRMNAPRILRELSGDFIAQVKVTSEMPKGAESVVGSRRPFHGAGLLLWVDEKTYIRLEKAQVVINGETSSYANFELRKDGDFTIGGSTDVTPSDKTTYLRLERRGSKVYGAASDDGIQWASLKPMDIELPKTVKVGILAGHNTSSGYDVAFEEFKVFRDEAK